MDTVTPAAVRPAEDVASLLRQADAMHKEAEQSRRKDLKRYREIGIVLVRAKEKAGHGNWLKDLGRHAPGIPKRKAQRYMAWAKCDAASHLDSADLDELESRWQGISGHAPAEEEPAPAPAITPGYSNAIRNWLDCICGQLMYFEADQGGLHKMLERPEMFDWDAMTRELVPGMEELAVIMVKYARGFKDYAESRSC